MRLKRRGFLQMLGVTPLALRSAADPPKGETLLCDKDAEPWRTFTWMSRRTLYSRCFVARPRRPMTAVLAPVPLGMPAFMTETPNEKGLHGGRYIIDKPNYLPGDTMWDISIYEMRGDEPATSDPCIGMISGIERT